MYECVIALYNTCSFMLNPVRLKVLTNHIEKCAVLLTLFWNNWSMGDLWPLAEFHFQSHLYNLSVQSLVYFVFAMCSCVHRFVFVLRQKISINYILWSLLYTTCHCFLFVGQALKFCKMLQDNYYCNKCIQHYRKAHKAPKVLFSSDSSDFILTFLSFK